MEASGTVTIENKYGLHARPAMKFAQLAGKYSSKISLISGDRAVDAKSVIDVLLLASAKGTQMSIKAEGDDAQEAVAALVKLVAEEFGEDKEE